MLGAIIGDIDESRLELDNYRSKELEMFVNDCLTTNESIKTLAVAVELIRKERDENK